jgi:dephospho-CoA kinase
MLKQKKRNKLVLGITGIFGSGKSTVAGMLKSRGADIIDADKLAHACLQPGNVCCNKIKALFGTVERKKLAQLVFGDRALLKKLNRIIHPEVIREIKARINRSKAKLIVLDAPLLVEAGLRNIVDKLIVVSITRKEQIKRLKSRSGLKESEILKRLKAQIPLSAKLRIADFIIDNSSTLTETRKQVREIAQQIFPRRR